MRIGPKPPRPRGWPASASRFQRPPLPVTAWTPADLGVKLKAWWDVKLAYGTARLVDDGGGLISSWTDEIAGIVLTGTTSARPTYSASTYCGGRKSLLFDGIANGLRGTAGISGLPNGATPGEIWVLSEATGAASGTDTLAEYGSVTNGLKRSLRRASTERLQVSDGTTSLTASGTAGSTSGAHMAAGNWDTTTEGGRIRGAPLSPLTVTISTLTTGTTRMAIGSSNSASAGNFASAAISAVLITTTLTYDERYRLEAWGYREIQGLYLMPNTQPYRETGPDGSITAATIPSFSAPSSGVSLLPLMMDFRTLDFFPNHISCVRSTPTYDYDVSGSLVTFAANVAARICHHPVTHEPFGLQNFASNGQYGSARSVPANQTITLPLVAGPYFSAYALGAGTMRMIFSSPVTLIGADGIATGVTTDDLTINAVDPNAVGYQAGAQLFQPAGDLTVQLEFAGALSHFQVESDMTTPPFLTGQRHTSIMTSPFPFLGLDPTITTLTLLLLVRPTHTRTGGTFLQIDDNISAGPSINSRRKFVWNYLGNPNLSDPTKNGQMGMTIDNINDDLDPAGVDPLDVVMVANAWRCFATTLDAPNGIIRVCANGGAVRESLFDPADFATTGMSKVRWMLQMFGAPMPGYKGGLLLHQDFLSAPDLSALSASGGAFTYT